MGTYIPNWLRAHKRLVEAGKSYNTPREAGTHEGEGWNGEGYVQLRRAEEILRALTSGGSIDTIIEVQRRESRRAALRSIGIYPNKGESVLKRESQEKNT